VCNVIVDDQAGNGPCDIFITNLDECMHGGVLNAFAFILKGESERRVCSGISFFVRSSAALRRALGSAVSEKNRYFVVLQ